MDIKDNFLKLFFFNLCFSIVCTASGLNLADYCFKQLSIFPGHYSDKTLNASCTETAVLNSCFSQKDERLILHFDRFSKKSDAKRILVFSLFHGDEIPAGSVSRFWMERLSEIDPRSTWRIVPVLNPDGVKVKTRTNGRGVDINRNLPTKNWNNQAHKNWHEREKKKKRRFPGESAGSEQETKCALKHIQNFKPDLIVSIHTPYGLLDFDGPKDKLKSVMGLPAKNLGHFPGSLGRYMWAERNIPVLTVELKGNSFINSKQELKRLQDQIGKMSLKL